MHIKKIRELTGLSQSQFANQYNIPLHTLQSWESQGAAKHRDCPEYVLQLLERVVKMDYKGQ